ncbi:DUF3530 family protein [uncultured Cocleimonas sp.]|uniref:DUF3530 family protein n=1 Tax=uncultured Cocleimonas sp. TaxID=1051587 RepID=UPI00261E7B9B|nr:DUF3530 family protein [uncultured Cocleimonas sp.]
MRKKSHPPTLKSFFTLFIALLLTNTVVFASDLDKEKRWAEQITDSLFDGEAIELNDGTNDFLAIDTRADEPKDVGVIVIHGIGIHPNWETVVKPLRVQLAAKGWNTLALQMPVLANDADGKDYEPLMKEVPARIDSGIRYLAKEGAKKVVIVSHSLGARMTNYYLAHKKVYKEAQTETPIIAYVGIGMNTDNEQFLEKINIPILDLYGEKDLEGVLKSAESRKKAGSHNKDYKQQKVAGANHFFEGQDDDLVNAVAAALEKF